MKIQAPPGMRDFYPADMRRQNWLFAAWQRASRAFGFEEYEGPLFEYLELYTLKSGEGIVAELFNFSDRGGRRFAIRPEMTPTLARMVAARAGGLPRPIKWFSIPRMCRAEKPQRGRLREFFQWNVDVLGSADMLADAEVIAVLVEFLRQVGLSPADVAVRVSSRQIATAALAALGIAPGDAVPAFELIDRYDKLGPDEFRRQWNERYGSSVNSDAIESYLQTAGSDLERALATAGRFDEHGQAAVAQFRELWERLRNLGVREYCEFDLKVVRGLAYYTGPVFELRARQVGLRALAGGGRYDNLCELLDGPPVPGVGFGMGDAPVLELLKELGRLPELEESLDVFVIDAIEQSFDRVLDVVGQLRRAGLACDFSYKRQAVGKQFKQAATRRARYAVVIGTELAERSELTVKNLATGNQQAVPAAALLADPRGVLAAV